MFDDTIQKTGQATEEEKNRREFLFIFSLLGRFGGSGLLCTN